MNDLKQLLRDNVSSPPGDGIDLGEVLASGRRRVRRRRGVVGLGAVVAAATVAVVAVGLPGLGSDRAGPAAQRPRPDAPTIRLSDAQRASVGRDYEVLATYTNRDLDAANGQYFDGVTDDGLILFQDGPRDGTRLRTRLALMDPATGTKDWLPDAGLGQDNIRPVQLGRHRIVLLSDNGTAEHWTAYTFDRETRSWSTTDWPGLPRTVELDGAQLGPDGRLYVRSLVRAGEIPDGGWPKQEDGDAEDADAQGDGYHLWSVSLSDGSDVRDEQLSVGAIAFTDDAMLWTDRADGDAGRVHVRDLATGTEHSFDPHLGARCNVLGFTASGDRIVMSEYCGTYGKVRDDRLQILTTSGDQVVTIQDDGVAGGVGADSDVVVADGYRQGDDSGTYLYDLRTNRLLHIAHRMSHWSVGGPTRRNEFFWHTPVNGGRGATWWLGKLLD
ncbi:hypothetical protein [Nocardioides sp. URHA0020]|uniref:hypothetical protein n=1 Tax=Nocardioides sp. URHA0020 TaxID=1380392 RepID=UPI0012DE1C8E|nr:hypothetical protein [Nocardioides sp. URHA0020]